MDKVRAWRLRPEREELLPPSNATRPRNAGAVLRHPERAEGRRGSGTRWRSSWGSRFAAVIAGPQPAPQSQRVRDVPPEVTAALQRLDGQGSSHRVARPCAAPVKGGNALYLLTSR